jgi:hypothetical protein
MFRKKSGPTRSVRVPAPGLSSFVEAARALECDESEERFDAALKKVAAHKPPSEEKTKEWRGGTTDGSKKKT